MMKRRRRFSAGGILLAGMLFSIAQVAAQVVRIAEMNTRQIQALNLQKTVVLIPGGILEEHGPYMPSYTDGFHFACPHPHGGSRIELVAIRQSSRYLLGMGLH